MIFAYVPINNCFLFISDLLANPKLRMFEIMFFIYFIPNIFYSVFFLFKMVQKYQISTFIIRISVIAIDCRDIIHVLTILRTFLTFAALYEVAETKVCELFPAFSVILPLLYYLELL